MSDTSSAPSTSAQLDLATSAPGLHTACVGVRWQPSLAALSAQHRSRPQVLAFGLRADGKRLGGRWTIFANNPVSPTQALTIGGDPYSGFVGDDLATINVDLPRMPSEVHAVAVWLLATCAGSAPPIELTSAAARLYDQHTGQVHHQFELSAPLGGQRRSAELCRFLRGDTGWQYQLIGESHPFRLEEIVERY